jgi:hypothetical protein
LETLRGSSNKKTLYSTRSCVNWAFFGTRGSLKHSFHSRFKVAHSCQKKSNLHTNSLNKLLFFNLVLFKTNALFAKTCPKDFYNSQKKSWDSFKPFPDSLHYFIIIHFLCCYRWPHLANKKSVRVIVSILIEQIHFLLFARYVPFLLQCALYTFLLRRYLKIKTGQPLYIRQHKKGLQNQKKKKPKLLKRREFYR